MAIIRQLTMGHRRLDTRIWVKQVATLRDAGLLNAYGVADGQGDACVDGVEIHDLGKLKAVGLAQGPPCNPGSTPQWSSPGRDTPFPRPALSTGYYSG